MAFVHRSRRQTSQPSFATSPAIGPGTYSTVDVAGGSPRLKLSYAPFSSSAERGIEDRFEHVDYTPGPGEYTINKIPGKASAPAISNSFTSGVPRFGRDLDPQLNLPGPGAYAPKLTSWIRDQKRGAVRPRNGGAPGARKGGVEWVRVSAPPSIPSPAQSFGYEENEAGELILQTPAAMPGHAGRGTDQVGPGEYLSAAHENILAYERKKGFAEWSKVRTHRANEAPLRRAASQPGPGAYAPDVVTSSSVVAPTTSRRGGKKISPFFASKVKRLRSADDVAAAARVSVPGPGSYNSNSDFDRVTAKFIPEQYQFFGSKTNRVVGGILANTNPTPGPGSYKVKSGLKIVDASAQDPYAPNLPFKSTSKRFEPDPTRDVPGPGAYTQLTNTSVELSKKIFGRNTSFGTTEERFHAGQNKTSTTGSDLAPTSYSPQNTGAIKTSGRKPLSVFASQTQRFDAARGKSVQEEKQAIDRANLGMASAMESVPIGIGHEPTWGNHSKLLNKSSMFSSNQARFDNKSFKNQASSPAVGPGSYSINSSNLYRSAPAVSSSFKNTERGTAGLGSVYRKDHFPGPGTYTKDVTSPQNSTFITRSFNITIATDV